MKKVIELTVAVEEAAKAYGNATTLVEKETAHSKLVCVRAQLNHELRKLNR